MKNHWLLYVIILLLTLGCSAQDYSSLARSSGALLHAAASGDLDATKAALVDGNLEQTNTEQRTALHLAAKNGYEDVVILLIESGANTDARDFRGQSPLHLGARWGHYLICDALIEAGADPNARDDREETPVHKAARGGRDAAMRSLLSGGGLANVKDYKGGTPIDAAEHARVGSWDIVVRQLKAKSELED